MAAQDDIKESSSDSLSMDVCKVYELCECEKQIEEIRRRLAHAHTLSERGAPSRLADSNLTFIARESRLDKDNHFEFSAFALVCHLFAPCPSHFQVKHGPATYSLPISNGMA